VRVRWLGAAAAAVLAACSASDATRPSDAPRPTAPATSASSAPTDATPSTAGAPGTLPPGPVAADDRALVTTTGVVVPVRERVARGWRVTTPCGADVVLAAGTPFRGATVVLDPGHGGDETGAVGPNGLTEKSLNLAVAEETRSQLQARGATAVLTRTGDHRVPLATRAEVATRLAPLAFVSIHHNADADGRSPRPGSETYHQVGSVPSKRLAGLVHEELVAAFSRFPGVAWHADADAGAKYRRNRRSEDYYGILRDSRGVPAVLSEALFLSNPAEAELLGRPEVRRVEAHALVRALTRFLTTSDPGSGFVEPYPRSEPAGPGGGRRGCVDPPLE
jgi:N-acetylmuramoyl-L-alanine amidase